MYVPGGTLAFATTTTSSSDVGTYKNAVTPSGLTSTNYTISFANGDMVVTPDALTITGSGAQVYGGCPVFAAAYSGFVLGQNNTALGGTLAFATTTTSSSDVGTYKSAVTPSGLTSTNYTISFANGDMVVTPDALTVTGSGTQVYGGSPVFAAAYTGFVLGQNNTALGGMLAFATTTTSSSDVGTYKNAVTPSGLTSTNYAITFATGDMVATPAALTIAADDKSKGYGAALPTLTARYSGVRQWRQRRQPDDATDALHHGHHEQPSVGQSLPDYRWRRRRSQLHDHVRGRRADGHASRADDHRGRPNDDLRRRAARADGDLQRAGEWRYAEHVWRQPERGAHGDRAGHEPRGSHAGAIVASGAVDADYAITYAPGKLTVTAAALTISANDQTMVYGGALPPLTVTYSGLVNGDTSSTFGVSPNVAPTVIAPATTNEMLAGETDRQIEQEITNLPEYGQHPPASPDGTATRLPDYYQQASPGSQQPASIAAKDALFAKLGG